MVGPVAIVGEAAQLMYPLALSTSMAEISHLQDGELYSTEVDQAVSKIRKVSWYFLFNSMCEIVVFKLYTIMTRLCYQLSRESI